VLIKTSTTVNGEAEFPKSGEAEFPTPRPYLAGITSRTGAGMPALRFSRSR
jgi:hypothetical protein